MMYPTLTPVGKPSNWYHKKKSRTELYHELSEQEKQIEQIKASELQVKASLQEDPEKEEEEEGEEGMEEPEEEEEEPEEPEDEEAEIPPSLYQPLYSESVDMEEEEEEEEEEEGSSLSYMYGYMQGDDDEDEDDDAY